MPPDQLFLLIALFFLPAALPSALGWLTGFLATPVCVPLVVHGYPKGLRLVAIALAVAGAGALAVRQIEMFAFSLTLVPLGVTLFSSVRAKESAVKSGAKGLAALAIAWILFWTVYGNLTGINSYNMLLKALDLGLEQTLELSKSKDAGLSPEIILRLSEVTAAMRETIPRVLPGLLAVMVMCTVWLNMVLINRLSGWLTGTTPWEPYTAWRLPEHLVWLPIGAIAVMLLGTGWLQDAGGWLAMIAGLLYLFQGLAVFVALLERWRVPPLVRTILYLIVFLQTYGLLLLAVLGLIDVWYDFRKTKETNA
ncbi:MAG: YybS family protein [Desulfobulbus sp.]|nr:YybS family protein [Desulfobulbus sp.]